MRRLSGRSAYEPWILLDEKDRRLSYEANTVLTSFLVAMILIAIGNFQNGIL